MKRINGYIAAPFTPMRENGALNLNVIPNYADFLLRNGLDGAFVCGSTGEGALLTLEERMAIAEEWMKYSRPNFKIIVHTGGTNLTDQQQLARHASDIGAFAIASMAPAFLPPQRNQELVQYCRVIAEAAPDFQNLPPLFSKEHRSAPYPSEVVSDRLPYRQSSGRIIGFAREKRKYHPDPANSYNWGNAKNRTHH